MYRSQTQCTILSIITIAVQKLDPVVRLQTGWREEAVRASCFVLFFKFFIPCLVSIITVQTGMFAKCSH